MYRNQIKPPGNGAGLFLYLLQHLGFIAYIYYQISEINSYRTETPGSVTVAEAAYLTSQWTQVVVSCCAWIAWTLFCATFILANRITRLHDAYLSSFPVPPEPPLEASTDPLAPRVGNHSLAGVTRREVYAGRDFTVHGDGMVVSRLGNDVATWRTEAEFKDWADRQTSPYSS